MKNDPIKLLQNNPTTMNTLEAIHTRRSIKHFDAHHRMTAQEIEELLALALLSPTAFNIQNWRFVILEDAHLRQKVRAASWNQTQITDASLVIVLCADLKAWEKQPERYWAHSPANVREFMVQAIDDYYRDKTQTQRDEGMRSCALAAQTLMLAAQSLGYDSCPIGGFDANKVAQLIRLPSDHVIAMLVAIGKGTKEAWPRPGQLSLNEVVIKNMFEKGS